MSITNKILFRMYSTRIISLQEFIKNNKYLFDKLLFDGIKIEQIKELSDKDQKELLHNLEIIDSVSMKKLDLLENEKYLTLFAEMGFNDTYKLFKKKNKIEIDEKYIINSKRPVSCINKLLIDNIDYKPSYELLKSLNEEDLNHLYNKSYLNYDIRQDIEKILYGDKVIDINDKAKIKRSKEYAKLIEITKTANFNDPIYIKYIMNKLGLSNIDDISINEKDKLRKMLIETLRECRNKGNILDKIHIIYYSDINKKIINLKSPEIIDKRYKLYTNSELINIDIKNLETREEWIEKVRNGLSSSENKKNNTYEFKCNPSASNENSEINECKVYQFKRK